ncbi:MAG TPA: O-methyltransferase [Gaiellaceae bacterium]|nr:O-methyltransferase [Gaiellaceae bacterium]
MAYDFEEVQAYAEAHTAPVPEILRRLGEETEASTDVPQMSVGPNEGAFLRFLVSLMKPQLVLEIGVFTGWSGIEMARGLPEGGKIIALDLEEETTAIARRYAEEMGVADRIDHRVGDAKEMLAHLDGPFDLVFIDAWKPDYVEYYENVLPKLADGGLILADNTLGALEGNPGIAEFNEHVLADERVESVLVPIRDGLTMIRRR